MNSRDTSRLMANIIDASLHAQINVLFVMGSLLIKIFISLRESLVIKHETL